MRRAIVLVEVGIVPAQVIEWLAGRLQKHLGVPVTSNTPISVPNFAFDQGRNQYRSGAIIDLLRQYPDRNDKIVMGVIESDCFNENQEYVMGQAAAGEHTAFVAIHRLRSSLYGLREDMSILRGRIFNQALHELGHAAGLHPCLQPRCVMHCTSSIIELDIRRNSFCFHCKRDKDGLHEQSIL